MMIAPEVVDEIERLLAEGGLSQRGIARKVGVSRGTVHAIARGKRPDYSTRKRESERDFVTPRGPWARCPTCGGMVQMPCLACRVRAMRQDRGSAGSAAGPPHSHVRPQERPELPPFYGGNERLAVAVSPRIR